jgi:predicted DCC family thiol-disulfide oxidoreductase YuxK
LLLNRLYDKAGFYFYTVNTEVGKKIILFDGVCNLCNSSVQFIVRHDKKNQFLFSSLQSEAGQFYLKKCNLPQNTFNSFLLVDDDKIYTRSAGALRVLKYLESGWKLLYAFIIVPKFMRDGVYNFISKNRYKWFGKKDACWVPTPELKEKFLD